MREALGHFKIVNELIANYLSHFKGGEKKQRGYLSVDPYRYLRA